MFFVIFLLGMCCVGPSENTGPLYQSSVRTLWRSLGERATSLTLQVEVSCPLGASEGGEEPGGRRHGASLPWQVNKGGGVRVNGWVYGQLKKYIWTKKMVTEKVQDTCLHFMEPFKEITNVNKELL